MINYIEGLVVGVILYIAGAPLWVAVFIAYGVGIMLNFIEYQTRRK